VAEAKDLKPRRVRLFRYKLPPSVRSPAPYRPEASETANCSMTRVPRVGGTGEVGGGMPKQPEVSGDGAISCDRNVDARVTIDK